jgi:hypothetical protein
VALSLVLVLLFKQLLVVQLFHMFPYQVFQILSIVFLHIDNHLSNYLNLVLHF